MNLFSYSVNLFSRDPYIIKDCHFIIVKLLKPSPNLRKRHQLHFLTWAHIYNGMLQKLQDDLKCICWSEILKCAQPRIRKKRIYRGKHGYKIAILERHFHWKYFMKRSPVKSVGIWQRRPFRYLPAQNQGKNGSFDGNASLNPFWLPNNCNFLVSLYAIHQYCRIDDFKDYIQNFDILAVKDMWGALRKYSAALFKT